MNKMELTLYERKKLQLEMLDEIDSFCRNNNIKYALSCGTLIGAIRHKGYIPWDDDVDITMLYSDVLRFRELFHSDNLKYCDIETEPNYAFHFSRVISKKTYSKIGCHRSNGVCIDLYPIIECTNNPEKQEKLIVKGNALLQKRLWYIKWRSRVLRFTPFSFFPGYRKAIRNYYDFMIKDVQLEGGGFYYQMGGPLVGNGNNFYHNLWPFNPFEQLINVPFENLSLFIPAKYDEFLKIRYGDYMQLPPLENRYPYHGGHYYWNE